MGFRISWDADRIASDLRACAAQVRSGYNDGFTAWHCKKDLIRLQYMLQDLLESCPEFAGESEFRDELNKQKVWRVLNDRKV